MIRCQQEPSRRSARDFGRALSALPERSGVANVPLHLVAVFTLVAITPPCFSKLAIEDGSSVAGARRSRIVTQTASALTIFLVPLCQ